MNAPRRLLVLRLLLGGLFCLAGLAKLFAPAETAALLADKGIPYAWAVGLAVGGLELGAGAAILAGVRVPTVARVLIVVIVLCAAVFHMPLLSPPGLAHAKAVALTFDLIVVLGLVLAARDASNAGTRTPRASTG